MTRLRAIYTRVDKGVSVIIPFQYGMDALMYGGALPLSVWYRAEFRKWAHQKLKVKPETWREWVRDGAPKHIMQLWEMTKRVMNRDWRSDLGGDRRIELAARYAEAIADGGLSEREAMEMIAEVCRTPDAKNLEIVDVSEIPTDRTHRNRWRRSSNGGPIWADSDYVGAAP